MKIYKKGFTLAEVLITLAIIGVVASLTVPTLVQNYQKQQTVIKLKKSYTELSNAINQSSIINGMPNTWDYTLSSKDFFNKYLKNYLTVTKTCKDNQTTKQCFGIEYYDMRGYLSDCTGSTTKNRCIYSLGKDGFKEILKDGTILYIGPYVEKSSYYRPISVDINGIKKPNIYGIDLFGFKVDEKFKSLSPLYWSDGIKRDDIKSSCSVDSNGGSCALLIMFDN